MTMRITTSLLVLLIPIALIAGLAGCGPVTGFPFPVYPDGVMVMFTLAGDPSADFGGVEALTRDGQRVRIDARLSYAFVPSDAEALDLERGGFRAEERNRSWLAPLLRATLRDLAATFDAAALYADSGAALASAALATLSTKLADEGLTAQRVEIIALVFSPEFTTLEARPTAAAAGTPTPSP
jgi:regulator of protease activity HflC (stomatin/prohibitin superfamily)